RYGMTGGVEMLTQSADDVPLREDSGQGVAVHDQGRPDVLPPHDGRRLGHGRRRIDRDQLSAHDVAHGGHGSSSAEGYSGDRPRAKPDSPAGVARRELTVGVRGQAPRSVGMTRSANSSTAREAVSKSMPG